MLTMLRATKEDYNCILKIWEQSVKSSHHFLSEDDFQFYKRNMPKWLDDVELCLWTDSKNHVIGFSGTNQEELAMLFLNPDFAGKGYGSHILPELIQTNSIKKVDVNSQNEHAKKFYLKHGFRIESEDTTDVWGKPYPILHLVRT